MICFSNPGTLDLRAITMIGLTSKTGQSKIGRFGTGFKYAIAVILRNGGSVTIFTGGTSHRVTSQTDTFRGAEYSQLLLNGEPLAFTTDLGRDWEPWMAFRELYSNALDEGGDVDHVEATPEVADDETLIAVDLPAFEAIFFTLEEHFVGKSDEPIWQNGSLAVYPGKSLFLFHRGIAVMKLKEPAAFRYNILGHLDLTEDRTAKYTWAATGVLQSAIAECDSAAVLHKALDNRQSFEAGLDFSAQTPTAAFLGEAVKLGNVCNPTAMALVKANLPRSKDMVTIFSTAQPGGAELRVALRKLRAAGADLALAKFALASGMNIYGRFMVKNDVVFLAESIFNNQERMTLAAFEGYAEVVGDGWLAKRLIDVTETAGAE